MKTKNVKKSRDLNALLKIPGSLYSKDINGVYLSCNTYMARMAGLDSPADIIGKTDNDMPWQEQAETLRIIDLEVMQSGESKTLEEVATLANGTLATYLTTKEPLRDENGQIIGIHGVSINITQHKQTTNQSISEKQTVVPAKIKNIFSNFDQIIACMPGSIYWKDTAGVYQGCNNQLLAAIGFSSKDQIIGKTDYDLAKIIKCDLATVEIFRKVDMEVIASGMPRLNVEEPPFCFINGEVVNQITNKVPLRDENNQIVGVLGVSIDITEHKKKEQAFIEQVVACIPGSVYWKDRNGVYRGCNTETARLIGMEKSEFLGETDYYLERKLNWPREVAEWIEKIDQEIIRSGQPRLNFEEIPFHFADGKTITQLSNKAPLYDENGNIVGLIGVSIDITERKRMEHALKEANKKIEKANQGLILMGGSIAHELRTPLTSIGLGIQGVQKYLPDLITAYQILNQKKMPDALRLDARFNSLKRIIQNIHTEISTANMFINMLLVNIRQPKIPLESAQSCSIAECIKQALARYPLECQEKDLITWKDNHDFIFQGDELLVTHIIFNLLKNALYYIKAARKGAISIWLEQDINRNSMHFKDTAKGIAPDILPHIFERFYSKTQNGSGIGLAFCKMTMQLLGGDITCQSVEHEYAEFILDFPVNRVDASK